MLYRVVLTFESVDEIPKCYHSYEINLKSSSFLYCCSFFKIVISLLGVISLKWSATHEQVTCATIQEALS